MTNDELSDAIRALIVVLDKPMLEQAPVYYADKEAELTQYLKESQHAIDSGWPSPNDTSFFFVYQHLTGGV